MTYYDEIASGYERLYREEQYAKLTLIKKHLKIVPDNKLLDIGCGTGWANEFFDCIYEGVDPSQKLIDIGLKKGLNLKKAGAEVLPYKEKDFDIVISVTSIQNFENIEKGIEEINRVAKKDIVITTLKNSTKIQDIEIKIREKLLVMDVIENEHDLFFFCKKKQKP